MPPEIPAEQASLIVQKKPLLIRDFSKKVSEKDEPYKNHSIFKGLWKILFFLKLFCAQLVLPISLQKTLLNGEDEMKNASKLIVLVIMSLFLSAELYAKSAVQRRAKRQQARVKTGIKKGKITKGEARRIKRNFNQTQRLAERIREDGQVTQRERARMHGKLNRNSRNIKRFKKNDIKPRMVKRNKDDSGNGIEIPEDGFTDTNQQDI